MNCEFDARLTSCRASPQPWPAVRPRQALPAFPTTRAPLEVYTVICTAWVKDAPTGKFVGALNVGPPVRATVNAEGPPQLIPTNIRVYTPFGRIDCGLTV